MPDRWDLEDADDGGLDHEPGDVRLNAQLRSVPRPLKMMLKPAEPPPEIRLAVFDRGEYVGRSPFDVGELSPDGKTMIRAGVPDGHLERIVSTADGGFAKSPPGNMDPTLYAACVSALAFRRGGKQVDVPNGYGQPQAINPWQQPQPVQPPWPPQNGYPQTQGYVQSPPAYAMDRQGRIAGVQAAVRMPCGHLSTDVAQGQGGRPVCGGCARLEALKMALAGLVGDNLAAVMEAVRDWEFQLRSELNV